MCVTNCFCFNETATTEIYTYDTLFPYTTLFRSEQLREAVAEHRVDLVERLLEQLLGLDIDLLDRFFQRFQRTVKIVMLLAQIRLARLRLFKFLDRSEVEDRKSTRLNSSH